MCGRTGPALARCILTLTLGALSGLLPVAAGAQNQAPAQPASPPGSVRTILKVSSEGTGDLDASLAELRRKRPELESLAERLRNDPADIEAIAETAEVCLQEKLYLGAHDLFQQLRLRAPEDPRAEIGLAMIWDAWGDRGLALQHALRAAALDVGSSKALETLGRIYLHRGEAEPALASLTGALTLRPGDPALLANIGYVHMLRMEWQEARRYLERAVEADGGVAETRSNLGVVLARLGDPEGALRQFTAASGRAAGHNNLGATYLVAGNWKAAREQFRLALAIDPEYGTARRNLSEAESHLPPSAAREVETSNRSQAPPEAQDRTKSAVAQAGNRDGVPSAPEAGSSDGSRADSGPPHVPGGDRRGEVDGIAPSLRIRPELPRKSSQIKETKASSLNSAFAIQFYASKNEENARVVCEALEKAAGIIPVIERADSQTAGTWYRAKLPGFRTFGAALETAEKFVKAGFIKDYWIVPPGD